MSDNRPAGTYTVSMFATVQRHLRRIRYYSASPERSAWHRAIDAALVITFALSFVVTFAAHLLVERPQATVTLKGRVYRDLDGRLAIDLVDPAGTVPWTQPRPVGELTLRADDVHSGWPMPTRSYKRAFLIDLNRFSEVNSQKNLPLAREPEIAEAIRTVLAADRPDALDRLESAESEMFWRGWAANIAMWWIMLYALSMALIGAVRLGSFLIRRRRLNRAYRLQQKGLCVNCGYDVRGLEFHERCPECGELMS